MLFLIFSAASPFASVCMGTQSTIALELRIRRTLKHWPTTKSNFVRTKTIGTALFWKNVTNCFSASDQNRASLQSMQYLEKRKASAQHELSPTDLPNTMQLPFQLSHTRTSCNESLDFFKIRSLCSFKPSRIMDD